MRLLLATLLLMSPAVQAAQRTTAVTSDGRVIQVLIDQDETRNSLSPAVIIAPGAGYHMELPLLDELAKSLVAKGFATYRFNWNYFSSQPQGEPSLDGEKEILDMQAVVNLAKATPSIDSAKLFIAGKSLGSRIAYRVFQRDSSLKALTLLTPVCTQSYDDNDQLLPKPIPSGEENYPNLGASTRPVLFATSSADPLCQNSMLLDFLKPHEGRFPVTIVGGNHSWDVVKGVDDETNARNKANRTVGVGFVTSWLGAFFQ